MLHLDLKTALQLVDDTIKREGADKIYRAPIDSVTEMDGPCLYVHPDESVASGFTPGCIVGHVLVDFGVAPKNLRAVREIANLAAVLKQAGIIAIEGDALNYLALLQWEQDSGVQWGTANQTARRRVGLGDAE